MNQQLLLDSFKVLPDDFLNPNKSTSDKKKEGKIAKIGAIDKTAFPIQGLYQRSDFGLL